MTAALRANDAYVVHGLDVDPANVSAARERVAAQGLYGSVSVALLRGTGLPYAESLVTLVVVSDPSGVPMAEVMRVLAPQGVAYVKTGGEWKKTIKPRPKDIDEWSHYLHDASGNAVAADQKVGPPKCPWTPRCGPSMPTTERLVRPSATTRLR